MFTVRLLRVDQLVSCGHSVIIWQIRRSRPLASTFIRLFTPTEWTQLHFDLGRTWRSREDSQIICLVDIGLSRTLVTRRVV